MTTHDELAARAQRKALDAVHAVADSPEARARTVAAIEAAMKDLSPAPVPRVSGAWRFALAAGLTLLLGAGWWLRSRPAGVGSVVASTGALAVGHRLADAEVIDSGNSELTLQLPRGVKVSLGAQSEVELADEGARVLVRRGEVAAEVTALESPFFLDSADAHVATRGARFTLKSGAGCDGRSRVSVTEGSVTINGTAVQAAEAWPRCAASLAPMPAPTPVIAPEPLPRPQQPTKRLTSPPLVKDEERLARQNELYLQAMTLQRAGDVRGAVKKLEVVLADPKSPLAETALAQKMRWLSTADRGAAREVAREYLQRFPMGFGRAEAETLVLEPP